MRSDRLLGIVLHLQLRGPSTARQLASRFEVSPRTILRDVEQLSGAGFPIYTRQGHDGGIALVDGYRTTLTGVVQDESDALAFMSVPAVARQLGVAAELLSARDKLLAALPVGAADRAQRVIDRFHVDPIDWYRRIDTPAVLPVLARAVWSETRISIGYETWTARSHRRVDPVGMVLKAGTWYLVADHEGHRGVYRVDRITDPVAVDEPGTPPEPQFRVADYWEQWLAGFEARLRVGSATVRLSEAGRADLARLGAHLADHAVEIGAVDPDGWSTVEIPIETIANTARDLLLLGDDFEVLEPADLRVAVQQRAQRIASRHR